MSADAVPAAVPGPDHTPGTTPATGPVAGLLASMVAPVEPARPTFNLAPDTTAQDAAGGGTNLPAGGVSSASHHGEEGPGSDPKTTTNGGTGKAKQGMIRALVLAAAARWGRGGGTANKRLDVQKAKAQARQIKEARQVTVNRSPADAFGGRGSNAAGPAGGKGLNGKSGADRATNGAQKNTGTGAKDNSRQNPPGPASRRNSGSGGGGSRGPAGGNGSAGTKPVDAPKQPKPSKADTTAPKPSKGSNGTDTKSAKSGTPTGGKNGAKGAAGTAGKAGKDGASPKPSAATKDPAKPAAKDTPAPKDRKKWSLVKDTTKTDKANDKTAPDTGGKPGTGNGKPPEKPAASEKATPGSTKQPDSPAGQKKADSAASTNATTDGKPFSTRESRETGYRDGTRAATAAAHVKAYRDGVKDGWADTTEAANREKTRLDQAHQDRKNARQETPVTTATSADHHDTIPDGVQPIKVDRIDATHLHLGNGATRTTIGRGEVRSLKQHERRLTERLDNLRKVTDLTKQLQAHAEGQAKKALDLLEKARSVEGGDKLTGKLSRFHENAKAQAAEAGEIHKRALRSADACEAVLANVGTRYADMYKAVVNSPESAPAELAYYQEA